MGGYFFIGQCNSKSIIQLIIANAIPAPRGNQGQRNEMAYINHAKQIAANIERNIAKMMPGKPVAPELIAAAHDAVPRIEWMTEPADVANEMLARLTATCLASQHCPAGMTTKALEPALRCLMLDAKR